MKSRAWPISRLAAAVAVLVALAAVGGFVLARHSVAGQNQALLRDESAQAGEYVSSLATGLGSTLQALAADVTATDASPLAFEVRAQRLAFGVTFVLARHTRAGFVVEGAAGSGFSAGQVLDGALGATLARAGASLVPGPVHFDGRVTTLGFALGPPLVPSGTAIYEQVSLDPYLAITASQGKPFRVLNAAVYGSRSARPDQLILANTRTVPLQGSVVETPVSVGSAKWWLMATARQPLAGNFPNKAPYVVLGVGLLLAVAVASAVEVLARRHEYSTMLVSKRTAELLESQKALVQSERLSAIGRMTTVISHELRTPLGAVLNELYLARSTLDDPKTAEAHLDQAERCTEMAANLANELTSYSRRREPSLASVDLRSLVDEVLRIVSLPRNVEFVLDVDEVVCQADREQLTQVLVNVVTNGIQAMPQGGALRLSAHDDGRSVTITVEDEGEGLDQAVADSMFEPFVTTKPSGTGLGLAVVRQLTEAHGGRVTLENGEVHGVVVTISLPSRSMPDVVSPSSPNGAGTETNGSAAHPGQAVHPTDAEHVNGVVGSDPVVVEH